SSPPLRATPSIALSYYLSLLSLFLFFFYDSPAPPVLPFFPTRRSSDLLVRGPDAAAGTVASLEDRDVVPVDGEDDVAILEARDRSEEHTSELQSLTNLVCRLLLEKKKKTKTTRTHT